MADDALIVQRSALGRRTRIAKGGTAVIYRTSDFRLPGADATIFKEYEQKVRAAAEPSLLPGLLAPLRVRNGLPPPLQVRRDRRIVWPLRTVVDGQDACGILMRIIPDRFFQPLRLLTEAPSRVRRAGRSVGATDAWCGRR